MSTDQLCMANIAYSVLVPEDGFDKGLIVYKYRQLNDWTLKGLVMSQAYFAQPAAFNDPFERKTFNDLNVDTSGFDREAAVRRILEGREIHFRRAKRIPNQYGLQLVEA